MTVPHPIPYQGSKRKLALTILRHCPPHVERIVEPFAGSAAVSLAAAYHKRADAFTINDAHEPIASLWRAILNRPHQLANQYEALWTEQLGRERTYYNEVRAEFNRAHKPQHFLYLLARCVKAAIRYNPRGEFNNSPDNRRLGARPDVMRNRIVGAYALLRGRTTVFNADYLDILDDCGPDDLVYMDPPYRGVCSGRDNRYAPTIDHDEFSDALAELCHRDCMFIVSYDGRTGDKSYGDPLPKRLGLTHLEVKVGRSTQATLLGRTCETYESLYLSPALVETLADHGTKPGRERQLTLVGAY